MIYTVTFNPAIDLVADISEVKEGEVNRLADEKIFFGGKGINVSLVLRELGVESTALGFIAGFTGDAIESYLRGAGIKTGFVRLENGFSRINIKLRSEKETELNGAGPDIGNNALDALFDRLSAVGEGDTLVLAGSVPKSLPDDTYERIAAAMQKKHSRLVVDADGKLLLNVLKYRPFLVKPNINELGGMFGVKLSGADEAAEYAKRLRDMGALNVLVSMAGDGALLIDENGKEHRCGVCRGTVRNSVGAGDSMVAGFLAGYIKYGDHALALKLGTAAGGATAFSDGLAVKEKITALFDELQ